MWWEIKKRAQWNNYNNCLTACNERNSYLDSYQIQQMFFWIKREIRHIFEKNSSPIIWGFISLTISSIIASVNLFIKNTKHKCLIVIGLSILASVLLYPFFHINELLNKIGDKIYLNEYTIWKELSSKLEFALVFTTGDLIKMLAPVILTVGASLMNAILSNE